MGRMCWAEISVPYWLSGGESNVEAATLGQVLDVAEEVHAKIVDTLAEPDRERDGHLFEASKVVRLDLVRDFDGIKNMGSLLDGLSFIKQSGRSRVARWADPGRARAETLSVGPRAWKAALYDKHTESAGLAPEGRMRYEARLHSDQLRGEWAKNSGGIVRTIADLDEQKCQGLRAAKWNDVGFGTEVTAMGRVQEMVFGKVDEVSGRDANGLTKHDQRQLWCYLTAARRGADIGMSRNTERKYRNLAGQLGITLGPEQLVDESRFTVQLDYVAGVEVLRAA